MLLKLSTEHTDHSINILHDCLPVAVIPGGIQKCEHVHVSQLFLPEIRGTTLLDISSVLSWFLRLTEMTGDIQHPKDSILFVSSATFDYYHHHHHYYCDHNRDRHNYSFTFFHRTVSRNLWRARNRRRRSFHRLPKIERDVFMQK